MNVEQEICTRPCGKTKKSFLSVACMTGSLAAVEYLKPKYAGQRLFDDTTKLVASILTGEARCVAYRQRGRYSDGRAADSSHDCGPSGNVQMTGLLIELAGRKDRRGHTALMLVAACGHKDIVAMLLDTEAGQFDKQGFLLSQPPFKRSSRAECKLLRLKRRGS